MRLIRFLLMASLLAGLLEACTTRNWYEGMQEGQRQQCRQRYPSATDQQDCIDKVNGTNYEQYQRERKAPPDQIKPDNR
jgi:hypothetical protein